MILVDVKKHKHLPHLGAQAKVLCTAVSVIKIKLFLSYDK